ncbi:MAG: hypothetical protein DMD65_03075 [Gemmatimonadetes bacterium]|nr:MAG: hypothetical protein DMD65_03075 [Gemmatimonadota bacterium]
MCALLAIATSGCEQIKSQYTKIKDTIVAKIAERRGRAPAAPAQPAPAQATPETPAPQPAPATPPAKPPRRPAIQAPEISRPTRDTPYDSPNTGTIDPGMSEEDVYSMWGPPVGVRRQADMTFLYYRNGCEYSCGTEDVVFLQNGKVVDAVLRWPGHRYSGQSSSPAATQPHLRRGGDTLTVKPPSSP